MLARTYRQSHRRDTSAMAPGSDIPAAMSNFELISSALPPGSDVADSPSIRGVMTHSGPQPHLDQTFTINASALTACVLRGRVGWRPFAFSIASRRAAVDLEGRPSDEARVV